MLNGFLVKTNVEVTPWGQTVITPNNKLKHYLLLFRFSFWRGNYLTELNVFTTADSHFLIKPLKKKKKRKKNVGGLRCSERRMVSNVFVFVVKLCNFDGLILAGHTSFCSPTPNAPKKMLYFCLFICFGAVDKKIIKKMLKQLLTGMTLG